MSTATLDRFSRYTGWAAYLSGAIAFISGVFLSLFYLYTLAPTAPGATSSIDFGYLNDIVGLFGTILMLPVPVALYWLTRRQGPALGLVAMALGLVGMLAIIVGQTLLIKDVISFDTSLPFSLIGLALTRRVADPGQLPRTRRRRSGALARMAGRTDRRGALPRG